jgi:ElaB/YqjD/DUF883 family membrane-anchored ribosome-binding protein
MKNRVFDKLFSTTIVKDRPADLPNAAKTRGGIRQKADWSRQAVEDFVVSHPALALGAAVSVGLLLGWWIKRK